jgi:hypothetical protein
MDIGDGNRDGGWRASSWMVMAMVMVMGMGIELSDW